MGSNVYNVIDDFEQASQEYISSNPFWIAAVFRLKYPNTYSRDTKASISTLFGDAVAIKGDPLIITDDAAQIQVSGSKGTYLMQAALQLYESNVNYLSEIFPGDHIMVWMLNNQRDYAELTKKLSIKGFDGKPLNKFKDGLKFVGRAQAIRKKITQLPSGERICRYHLTAVSFNEFDAQLFYEPHLAEKEPQISSYFGRLGTTLNQLVTEKGRGISINKAIPFFLDILLGRGVPANIGRGNDDQRLRATSGLTAPYAYVVPDIIGQALGKTKKGSPGGLTTFADILEAVIGIQHYSKTVLSSDEQALAPDGENVEELMVAKNFQPTGTLGGGSRRFADDMLGEFLPQTPHFYNKSVWTVLQQYLNPAINEMYTCLRVNPDGLVVPTLVVRQLPFTSDLLRTNLNVTRFLELPRWGVADVMIKDADIGRSDALRFNFVHIYGDTVDKSQPFAAQIVRNPPIRDDLDIARSGLRSHMQTVPCAPQDARGTGPKDWMEISSDILMGQHLTLTGMLSTVGIQAPICPGDNLQFDGVVYHIESITHSCGIGMDGNKYFTTTLSLSHGVRVNPGTGALGDLGIYGGTEPEDQTEYNPQVVVDFGKGE